MAKIEETPPAEASLDQAGQEIVQELRDIRADLAALVASLQSYGALGADVLKGRAQDLAAESLSQSLKAVRDLRQQVDALQKELEGDVRGHPFAWLIGAFGLGALIGLILSHRR